MFEEEEVNFSVEELNAAFNVFDENGDGFIDGKDLQSVMCRLGFKEGLEVEECTRMINQAALDHHHHHHNNGQIDFNGFVRFLLKG